MIKVDRCAKGISITLVVILCSSTVAQYFSSYGIEQTGSIQVNVLFNSGQRLSGYGVVLNVYQDTNQTALRVIHPASFPVTIDSLPIGHKYKIDVYRFSMYGASGYVDLTDAFEKIDVSIPLDGGITFNVFYNDGMTPIEGINISLKSPDGKEWAHGTTDDQGRSNQFWLQTTNKVGDYYTASFSIGKNLTYTYDQEIHIFLGSYENKIVTPWPPTVDSVLLSVYKSDTQKIGPSDGDFFVTLNDESGEQVSKSDINHGDAHFTKINVGSYSFHVIRVSQNQNGTDLGSIFVLIDGKQTQFSLILQNLTSGIPVNLQNGTVVFFPTYIRGLGVQENCQCVIFRFDDVQDYFVQSTTTGVLNYFMLNNKPLNLGIITNSTGRNPIIVNTIKEGIKKDLFTPALHGYTHVDYTKLDHFSQYQSLLAAQDKMKQLFGNTSNIFIPPYNAFNNVTAEVLPKVGVQLISAGPNIDWDIYHYSAKNEWNSSELYHVPAQTEFPETHYRELSPSPITATQEMRNINASLTNFGFAVVTIHPQDFAKKDKNGKFFRSINAINASQFHELSELFDDLDAKNIRITTFNEITGIPNKVFPDLGNSSLGVPDDPSVTNIFTFGKVPAGVAVNPTTNMIYVTHSKSDTVSVIDGSIGAVVDSIGVEDIPVGVSLNPSTNMIYVVNSYGGTVSVINGSTNTASDISSVRTLPYGIAVNQKTNTVYVIDPYKSEVDFVDGATNKIVNAVKVIGSPQRVAVNPNTNMIYVTDSKSPTVSVIDGSRYEVVKTIQLGNNSTTVAIAVNPSTNMIYVTHSKSPIVSVIDGSRYKVVKTIQLGPDISPLDAAVNPTTNTVYMTDPSGLVLAINGTTNTVFKKIELGNGSVPIGIAVDNKTNMIYVANSKSNTLGVISGNSQSSTPNIVSYKSQSFSKTTVPEFNTVSFMILALAVVIAMFFSRFKIEPLLPHKSI